MISELNSFTHEFTHTPCLGDVFMLEFRVQVRGKFSFDVLRAVRVTVDGNPITVTRLGRFINPQEEYQDFLSYFKINDPKEGQYEIIFYMLSDNVFKEINSEMIEIKNVRILPDPFHSILQSFHRDIIDNIDAKPSLKNPKNEIVKPIIFFHIPKTGGTTLFSILASNWAPDPIWHTELMGSFTAPELREKAKEYKYFTGHINWATAEMYFKGNFLALTILRDPIKRIISHFAEIKRKNNYLCVVTDDGQVSNISDLSLIDFINSEPHPAHAILRNYQSMQLGSRSYGAGAKQLRYLRQRFLLLPNEVELDLLKSRLENMMYFGITEQFNESIDLLCFNFRWRPIREIPALNKTQYSDEKIFNSDLLCQIEQINYLDLQLYAYAKKLFKEKHNSMVDTLLRKYASPYLAKQSIFSNNVKPQDIKDLLEVHYDRNSQKKIMAVINKNTEINMETCKLFGVTNLYPPESDRLLGVYRWTGPGLEAEFDIQKPKGEKLYICLSIIKLVSEKAFTAMEILIGGKKLDFKVLNPSCTPLDLPIELVTNIFTNPTSDHFLRVTIRSGEVKILDDGQRYLGIAIGRIMICSENL